MKTIVQLIREAVDLLEAAHPYGSTFWFNPQTQAMISCSDHGDRVAQSPDEFGIDDHVVQQMEIAAQRDDDDEEENLHAPVDGLWGSGTTGYWGVNDGWEQLAMNQGWVRVGLGGHTYASYVSGSDARSVWLTVVYLDGQGLLTEKLEIEISREQESRFVYLDAATIARFVRSGRNAEGFLARLGK